DTTTVTFPKLKDAVEEFLRRQVDRKEIRPSTAANYRNALRNWTCKVDIGAGRIIGELTVEKVMRKDIGALLGKVKEAGKSMAVIDQIRYPLNQLYTYYREEEVWPVELVNPAADLKYFTRGIQRKAKKRDLDIIPIDQGMKIIGECASNPRFQR